MFRKNEKKNLIKEIFKRNLKSFQIKLHYVNRKKNSFRHLESVHCKLLNY